MNDRWSELAEECWDERIDGYHFDQEMFAELIIRECIEIVKEQDTIPAEFVQAKLAHIHESAILNHFGLDE